MVKIRNRARKGEKAREREREDTCLIIRICIQNNQKQNSTESFIHKELSINE